MRPRKVARIAGMLLLALVTLSGCVRVEVVDTTPVAGTPGAAIKPAVVSGGGHNLAVLAVDFDPPLDYQQLVAQRQAVTLLVAIENTGDVTERDVTVRAQLSTPENPDFLLTQGASLVSIAPGEVQVAHFSRLGEIPYYPAYHLEVMVDPVAGEGDRSDNGKAFDIQVHEEPGNP